MTRACDIVICVCNIDGQIMHIKVNPDICKAPLNTKINAFSKPLRCGNTQFYLLTSHGCLYAPAAEHHRPLAGTHFVVPRRVVG